MSKFFENKPFEAIEIEKPKVDNAHFVKQNLMKSVDRSPEVRKAVEDWLYSFEGALTKKAFAYQLSRLDFDDSKALEQLERAKGRRTIPLPPPPKLPVMQKPLIAQMADDVYVAIRGRGFKKAVKEVIPQLRQYGSVYVLRMEEFILEFKSYENKGNAYTMIQDAIDADFLIVLDLEIPMKLEWHVNEAIERIGRMREEKNLPIIASWNRFNDCNRFFSRFKMYEIK